MSENILIKINRDPLSGMTREEYKSLISGKLKGRVIEAYIFGSFNSDRFNRFSDIDLLIVCDTERPFVDRGFDFFDIQDIVPATDILVYTPDEFRDIMKEESTGFWSSVKGSMVKII